MMEIFSNSSGHTKDLAYEQLGEHPKTFLYLDLDKKRNEQYKEVKLNACLDYIFEKCHSKENNIQKHIKVIENSIKIEQFEVHTEKLYHAVSDH